jgi:hypothetical protein
MTRSSARDRLRLDMCLTIVIQQPAAQSSSEARVVMTRRGCYDVLYAAKAHSRNFLESPIGRVLPSEWRWGMTATLHGTIMDCDCSSAPSDNVPHSRDWHFHFDQRCKVCTTDRNSAGEAQKSTRGATVPHQNRRRKVELNLRQAVDATNTIDIGR